ncbi:MAG TPA: flagellar basal body P-ring formation chaperone FlgA [Verrucomicrobiae bacterium]
MKFFNLSKSIIAVCLLAGSVTQLCAAESATAVTNAAVSNSATNTAPAMRQLAESDLLELLTATLQKDYVKDLGELELRLTRPWTARSVPDEPLAIEVLDLPKQGVTPNFILRFELRTAEKSLGTFQISLQARVWREIWIARSALKRGELIADADLDRQRRDVLTLRESLAEFSAGDTTLEIAEPLQTGSALLARSVKVRPVIHRGQATDALIQDGALSITMKVEALEDGIPGQIIRARNPQTRRDLRGKVIDEQTILLAL